MFLSNNQSALLRVILKGLEKNFFKSVGPGNSTFLLIFRFERLYLPIVIYPIDSIASPEEIRGIWLDSNIK